MYKLSIVIVFVAIAFTTSLNAQQQKNKYEKLDMSMYPSVKEHFKQVYFQLPIEANENELKVELFVGKDQLVDCNNYFMNGNIKEEIVDGWGYNYYSVASDEKVAGTLMGCPDNKKTTKFIHLQPELVRYNSRLPFVFYVPNNLEVKYRIWRADKVMMKAVLKKKGTAVTSQKIIIISADTAPCQAGVLLKDCMLLKYSKYQKEWSNFYDVIEGFEYEKGNEYEIVVKEQKISNPPADASNLKYTLVKILSKKKVNAANVGNKSIEDKRWKLVELNGQAIKGDKETHYLIFHSKENKIEAKVNCNVLQFGYQLKNQFRLIVSPGISTMMACPDHLEDEFKEVLNAVDNVSYKGNQLSINKGRMAPLARFELVK
jgi:ecotin